jgi:hypothetical protein
MAKKAAYAQIVVSDEAASIRMRDYTSNWPESGYKNYISVYGSMHAPGDDTSNDDPIWTAFGSTDDDKPSGRELQAAYKRVIADLIEQAATLGYTRASIFRRDTGCTSYRLVKPAAAKAA